MAPAAIAIIAEARMMADPSAAERAYQRLRRDILNGTLPMGPMDIRGLGDRLRMSVTPVREALARLSAERLVTLAPHHGYVVANPSARRLEHIYELAGALIDLSLDRAGGTGWARLPGNRRQKASGVYADDMATLMREIATAQSNLELAEHALALNDRLFPARRCEPKLFADAGQEVAVLGALWDSQSYGDLRLLLRKHHRTRMDRVDALARLMVEQAGDR